MFFKRASLRIAVEDKAWKGERGGFLKRIHIPVLFRKAAMSSRPIDFYGTLYTKTTVQFVRSPSSSGGTIFYLGISPDHDSSSIRKCTVRNIVRTDFDQSIEVVEIRKYRHASSGNNYFAPKSHEVRAMTEETWHCRHPSGLNRSLIVFYFAHDSLFLPLSFPLSLSLPLSFSLRSLFVSSVTFRAC